MIWPKHASRNFSEISVIYLPIIRASYTKHLESSICLHDSMFYESTNSALKFCHIESKQKTWKQEKFGQSSESWTSWRIIRVGNKNIDTNLTNTHWIKWQCQELTSPPPPWLSKTSRGGRTNIWQIEITFPIGRNANFKENIYTAHIVTCSHAIRGEANGKQTIVTSSPLHTSQCCLRIANFTIKGHQKGFFK